MNESVALGIAVVIYIMSVITAWFFTVKVYQKKYTYQKPDEMDVLFIFAPMVNTVFAIGYGIELFFEKRNKTFIEWFFRQ